LEVIVLTGTEILTAIGLLFGGGAGGGILSMWGMNKKLSLEKSLSDTAAAKQFRDELREEMASMRKELKRQGAELSKWKDSYYIVRRYYFLVREDLESAVKQLQEHGVSVEIRALPEPVLEYDEPLEVNDEST
jgi:hypothetical protein